MRFLSKKCAFVTFQYIQFCNADMLYEITFWSGFIPALLGSVWTNGRRIKTSITSAMLRKLRVKQLQTHLFIRAVVPHRQATDGSEGVEQVQPLLWAPNGTVISPGGTLPPTQSIHHPVTKLKQISTNLKNQSEVFTILKTRSRKCISYSRR